MEAWTWEDGMKFQGPKPMYSNAPCNAHGYDCWENIVLNIKYNTTAVQKLPLSFGLMVIINELLHLSL